MNPDSSSALLFGLFPSVAGQHAEEWPQFLARITSFALAATTGQEGGLVGFILDAPTYLLDYVHAFVPYIHPGPTPANTAGAGTWEAHKIATANWRTESSVINAFMVAIFKSLDQIAIAWFFSTSS
jgi:hypothetical protein